MELIQIILSVICAVFALGYGIVLFMFIYNIDQQTGALVKELRAIRADFQAYKRANNI